MHWAHCTEILYSTARSGQDWNFDDRNIVNPEWNQILLLLSEFTAVPSKGVDDALGAVLYKCHAEPSLQAAENRRHSIDH